MAWESDLALLCWSSKQERRDSPLVSQIITLLNSLAPPSLKHCILMS